MLCPSLLPAICLFLNLHLLFPLKTLCKSMWFPCYCHASFLHPLLFYQGAEEEAFPNSSLSHVHTIIPPFLLMNKHCSVILLPSADFHAHTKIFPAYSVVASRKSNSLQAIKVFSCLCADLIGKVERQFLFVAKG